MYSLYAVLCYLFIKFTSCISKMVKCNKHNQKFTWMLKLILEFFVISKHFEKVFYYFLFMFSRLKRKLKKQNLSLKKLVHFCRWMSWNAEKEFLDAWDIVLHLMSLKLKDELRVKSAGKWIFLILFANIKLYNCLHSYFYICVPKIVVIE